MFGKREEVRVTNQEIKTLIGLGCLFDGNLTVSEGLMRIDGEIRGNISGKGGLILGERGIVKGDISLEKVIVYGRVQGNISAQSLELKSGSRVDGNIHVEELVIERGAVYNGECKMEGGSPPKEVQSSSVDISPTGSPSS
ncbi:MAG: polymer-forming cytoskeletal protein [Hydrogenobacter sp.]